MKTLLICVMALLVISEVHSLCCDPAFRDNNKKNLAGCCSYGSCNIFCCQCLDSCIPNCPTFSLKKPDAPLTAGSHDTEVLKAKERFNLIDSDKNGIIEFKEAAAYFNLPVDTVDSHPKWFTDVDKNGDGVITPNELDSLL